MLETAGVNQTDRDTGEAPLDLASAEAPISGPALREEADSSGQFLKIEIPRKLVTDGQTPVKWYDLTAPEGGDWDKLNKLLGKEVSRGTFELCLQKDSTPQTFLRNGILYLALPEFASNPADPHAPHLNTLHLLITDGVIVTVHSEPSHSIKHLRAQLGAQEPKSLDFAFSSHLAARLAGSLLAVNDRTFFELAQARRDLLDSLGGELPAPAELRDLSRIERSLILGEEHFSRTKPVLHALKEKEHLFGAPGAKDALGRYDGLVDVITTAIKMNGVAINSARQNWDVQSEAQVARGQNRIANVVSFAAAPGLWSAIVQTANSAGAGLSASTFWWGLAASCAIGAGIVGLFQNSRRK